MERWFLKWGLTIYAICVFCWFIGYVKDWDNLLWAGVVVALLTTAVVEALEWRQSYKKRHLVIPGFMVFLLMACMFMLLNRLL